MSLKLREHSHLTVSECLSNFNLTQSALKRESLKFFELREKGYPEDELIEVANDLLKNGILKTNEKCDRPFSYLASGTYEKVFNRCNGIVSKSDFCEQRIMESIQRHSTREPLPEDFKATMSKKELEWISSNGGRMAIGQWTEAKIRQQLSMAKGRM